MRALAALLLVLAAAAAAESDLARDVDGDFARAEVRGASVAWVRPDRAPWTHAFGVRDVRTGEPVTGRTIFQAASIGKVVAAYAALRLVEQGVFDLDAPVRGHGLVSESGCEPPTLRHLLSHTAGLSNQILATRFEAACHPPEPFAYAGQGWLVLQRMLEAHGGTSADAFVRETVLAPLGMEDSGFATPHAGDRAVGHVDALWGIGTRSADGGVIAVGAGALGLAFLASWLVARRLRRRLRGWRSVLAIAGTWLALALALAAAGAAWIVPVRPWSERVLLPSSFHTSAEDLARFAEEILRPRLLRPETRDLLFASQVELGDGLAWGVGLGLDASTEPTTGWQWGSNPGSQGLLVLEPEAGQGILVLTNTGGFADVLSLRRGGHNAAKRIARRVLGIRGRWDLRPGTAP